MNKENGYNSGYTTGYVDGLRIGYEQGRADAFCEIAYSDCVNKEPFEILAYKKGRTEERKAIFDELYNKLLNEDEETVIEWCQSNLIDDVEDYIEKGGAE